MASIAFSYVACYDIKIIKYNFLYLLFPFNSTMPSGMCKFCTHLFFVQLFFFKNIINVASYNSSVFLKQLCHLSLCKPHGVILQTNINLSLSVLRLIDYKLVLFHLAC